MLGDKYEPFSSERDGSIWWNGIKDNRPKMTKWIFKLAQAERRGVHTYQAIIDAGNYPQWAYDHLVRIRDQERVHANLVGSVCLNEYRMNVIHPPLNKTIKLSDVVRNEVRSLMRLETITLNQSTNPFVENMISSLIIDETYHCWFVAKLFEQMGDFEITVKD